MNTSYTTIYIYTARLTFKKNTDTKKKILIIKTLNLHEKSIFLLLDSSHQIERNLNMFSYTFLLLNIVLRFLK